MKQAGATTYLVNGLGQRVKKANGAETYFAYDEAGHLLGEYDGTGAAIQETVWLGNLPVAVVKPNGASNDVFYVWPDHLGSPRLITDAANQSRWEWPNSDPFGNNAPNENPAGAGSFAYNLRFPGQYFDSETGTNYNLNRDYDPKLGRYLQSDLIGLSGGLNTYAYVGGNPLYWSDPLGLARKLSPDSQECKDLEKKIKNIRDDIEKRKTDIMFNRRDLPLTPPYPGAPNAASVAGHQKIIDELKDILNRRVREYANKCGCNPDDSCSGGGGNSGTSSAGSSSMSTAAKVGVGAVGAACVALCVLQPELCVPVLLIGGAAAQ
jgi:RHS repeat-associated protein